MSNEYSTEQYTVDVKIDENSGQVIRETWRNARGQVERLNDQPAITGYNPVDGAIIELRWFKRGGHHRTGDKPAVLRFSDVSGNKIAEAFWENDRPHRKTNTPTCSKWTPDGKLLSREFFVSGKTHRSDGPAIEFYSDNSEKPTTEQYWLDSKRVEPF